ncbi:SUKH-4 family immunity protein [Glycomyces sp. TRM65418]|uniref:SUKH-4 family immunity protein n=1 Tax=Glycomyces sp. TRM65418 TaxID=2867006 RepID=UPI001CE57989|nr:SUKH-4 family immunity protein [Glycomyces sp. TRM65418]MCC3763965.1 SUKH-4 family immunity protein [Glycomyces sp. TRM65418]QZD53664.1 SUKH-4 family immunity protein [Glycomyces sp. TRM65418]
MTDSDAYLRAWEPDNVIEYPRAQWIGEFAAPASVYPEVDFLPIDMSAVYTAYLDGARFDLYSRIDLDMGEEGTLALAVIGAVPHDRDDMLFCLDTESGQVLLLGVEDGTLELVNSTFKAFAEFLYRFALFVDADTGSAGRARRAAGLRTAMRGVDPEALADRESWWSIALMQLEGAKG